MIEVIEQSRETQRRIIAAQIPPRLRGLSMLPGEERLLEGVVVKPQVRVTTYVENVLHGDVVAAQGRYKTCGLGLWATNTRATEFVTALMRDFMVLDTYTGLYVTADAYLESMRPDGEGQFSDQAAEASFMVLAHVGQEAMTDWTRSTIRALLMKRYEAGLPTLVSSTVEPTEYLVESLADSMFLRVGIMESA